jgi:zinc-ribbon domain
MDLGAILLLLAVLIGVGLFLAAPLMSRLPRGVPQESREASSLMAERDRVINALQELDFDFKLGKIPEEDYPGQRTTLLQRGAEILRKLDALLPSTTAGSSASSDAGARIEEAAAAGRADSSSARKPLADDRIESMLTARRVARRARSAGFCPRCGKPVLVTDKFCPNCGKALQ